MVRMMSSRSLATTTGRLAKPARRDSSLILSAPKPGYAAVLNAITAWLRKVRIRLSSRSPSAMPPVVALSA